MIAFLIAAMVILFVAVAVVAGIAAHRKRIALEELSRRTGWPLRRNDRELPTRFHGFAPFGKGHGRRATWVFEAQHEGLAVTVFEYRYKERQHNPKGGSSDRTYTFKVATVAAPVTGRDLTISPETVFHKVYDALGGEDINFESDEFSRSFWVRCPDRRFAYDIVSPAMIEYLLANRPWHWQWRGSRILVYRSGGLRPDDVEALVGLVAGFVQRVPRHVTAA